MTENDVAREIVNAAFQIHSRIGPGLLESVYETPLEAKLRALGFSVQRQKAIALRFDDLDIEVGFRADLIVGNLVIIEVKSVETIHPVHFKQLLTRLCMTDLKLGLLINFQVTLIKDGITRIANRL